MRGPVCFASLLVLSLLANPSAVAQENIDGLFSGQTPEPAPLLGTDVRERGLAALQAGNYVSAVAALRQAVALGDDEAMRHLGDMTFSGRGVAQSYKQGIQWYCRAALAGNPHAVDRLMAVDLGGWSEIRGTEGWKTACEQWLEPPRAIQSEKSPAAPTRSIEIRIEQEREIYAPPVAWPGYWYWQAHPPRPPHQPPRVPFSPHLFQR